MIVVIDGESHTHVWQADRMLAKSLLRYIEDSLHQYNASWGDITGLGVHRGPGSFTGLRIGMTVMNTLADALSIPIVGVTGEAWQSTALLRLKAGENDYIVLPEYGGEAHVTLSRK